MSAVVVGKKVKIHYTGTFDDGEVFDTSREAEPLEFEVGTGQVIPGFDLAVIGMKVGEQKQVRLPEEQAYGPYNQEMVFDADPNQFEDGLTPEVGQQFQTQLEDGTPLLLTVKSAEEGKIVLDANHPMAGKALNFDLEVVEIN
ncbi:FKBP-type peptidyl-prolyl cis-trans isomerase 2 [Desulfuromusa kysingii]|uniref:Peptidyl-prolyl cis-trans isomerase n=1 Tax=Desulfuromusa kysingii TaxID=37625 RepID=A0A1H3XLY1_9BACT|nr:peptidylprolyl isomerase [Desulfuromusa kysingii]SEA00240.1 FKBP-type peptidyl-prolyl cis-trans isomerase 2 [Desulfuromusa kysingii]